LEIVAPGFTAIIFAGAGQTSALNRDLARGILLYGGKALWVDSIPDSEIHLLLLPATSELTHPLVELLSM